MKKALVLTLTALAVFGCFFFTVFLDSARGLFGMSADALAGDPRMSREAPAVSMALPGAPPPLLEPEPQLAEEGRMGKKDKPKMKALEKGGIAGLGMAGGGGYGSGYGSGLLDAKKAADEASAPADGAEGGESAAATAPTRAWFPETFLFEPLIVTDAEGKASVPVKVPDRLTTWRVLALAHARSGSQAGAVASFLGTLPTYVEPVTPPTLYTGDVVKLPVQVVNTTDAALTSALTLEATNATLSSAGGQVKVPGYGSTVQYVTLTTQKPGRVTLRAGLGGTDAVEKQIDVQPAGQRRAVSKGGTLAAPRTFHLEGPADALPGTEAVRVRIFPGALGLVRAELSAAPGRGGLAEDGYLLQLLGEAPALLKKLGAEPAKETIRELSVLATQRVMRHARTPSVDAATLLAEAALAHPENPVLARLGERLAQQIASSQRGDGTCEGVTGWTLQRLLVTTSDCVRAVRASAASPSAKQRATAMALKASGAFERNLGRVNDGYTAAAILASGAVSGSVADGLKKLVKDALRTSDDGAKYLEVQPGVVRADGAAPSTYEATALAILALADDPQAPLADLGTYLLSGYSALWGWGDGRANLVCLRAAVQLFKDPVPAGVKVTLERDGKPLASGELSAAALTEVLTLDADATGSGGKHEWTVKADPPVPGLGYALTLVAFTPWKDEPFGGVQLTTTVPDNLEVGRAADLEIIASVPAELSTVIDLSLPAGVQVDSPALENLVSSAQLSRYERQDGRLTLYVPPMPAGATFHTKVKVVPTLAGTLHAAPSSVMPEGRPQQAKAFAPKTWVVR
ncbi:MAG: alpha-2-macroglobulin family protein [Myxococcota bacterium]